MIPVRSFAHKTVAVFGLARTGRAVVTRADRMGGAEILSPGTTTRRTRAAGSEDGATITPWRDWQWEGVAALVLSPGVPLTHPRPHEIVGHAKKAGVPVIGDVELFAREIRPDPKKPGRAPVIAITGANGKSTTTALLAHILKHNGFDAEVGGNIGRKSALDPFAPPSEKSIYVLEMSRLPDRSRARPNARCHGAFQSRPRSHRPPRHDGELRPDQGAAARPDCAGRHRHCRRR